MYYTLKLSTKIFLIIGCCLMFLMQIIRRDKYELSKIKSIISFICIVFCGILGTYFMFYLENRVWGGISFYGAILIGPILFYPFVKVLKLNYGKVLSWCAPTICIVHIMSKINCYMSECCYGNEVYNKIMPIPLQLLEGLLILLIMFFLLYLERKENNRSRIYPIYLVLYGIGRFILNSFRADLSMFILLPPGHSWSLISIIVGGMLITIDYLKHKSNK